MSKNFVWTKGKIAIVSICVILALFLAFCISTIIATPIGNNCTKKYAKSFAKVANVDQLTPVKDSDGYWTFTTDREFKIMQMTDLHIGGGWMSFAEDRMVFNAMAAMISAEKPDLVVFTGDIAFPVPFTAGTADNASQPKLLAEFMENLGVYWTLTFGNHDSEIYSFHNREYISNFYANSGYKYCLFQQNNADIFGQGNHIIKVKNSQGLVNQALIMLDSNSYPEHNKLGLSWEYDNIHDDQIEWCRSELVKIDTDNKARATSLGKTVGAVKTLMFFHIPLEEHRIAYDEYRANGDKDTADVQYLFGVIKEKAPSVFCGEKPNELFETVTKVSDLQGIFVGHDHLNNASYMYKGVQLSYGMSIDYLAYAGIDKQKEQRGCNVITVAVDGTMKSHIENYYQDKYPSKYPKENMQAK